MMIFLLAANARTSHLGSGAVSSYSESGDLSFDHPWGVARSGLQSSPRSRHCLEDAVASTGRAGEQESRYSMSLQEAEFP